MVSSFYSVTLILRSAWKESLIGDFSFLLQNEIVHQISLETIWNQSNPRNLLQYVSDSSTRSVKIYIPLIMFGIEYLFLT